jgi:hypothetical protein
VTKPKPIILPPLARLNSPNQSSRRGAKVSLITVHRPVGSYKGAIATLMNPAPGGDPEAAASAHIIMAPGGHEATQLVPWNRKAWACVSFNAISDNIEIADEAWTGKDPHGFAVAARIVAFRCHIRGIPPRWVHGDQLLHHAGVTRHYDLGAAGGGHSDPTLDPKVWTAFMLSVKYEIDRGGFRKTWGRGDPVAP